MTAESAEQSKPAASLRSSVLQGGSALFARQVVSLGLKMIGVLLITRVLGPEHYGAYAAAIGIYQFLLSLGQAGLGVYLLRYPDELTDRHLGTSYTLLALFSITMLLVTEAAVTKVTAFMGIPQAAIDMRIIAFCIPLQMLSIPSTAILERRLEYKSVAMLEISGQVIYYVVALPLALYLRDERSLVVALLLQLAAVLVFSHVLAGTTPVLRFDRRISRDMLSYSAAFSTQNWIWQARSLVNPLVIGPALGSYSVGIVGMAIGILEMLCVLRAIAWRLSVSVLRRFTNDLPRIRTAVAEGMQIQLLAIGVLIVGFSFAAPVAIPLVFGSRWLPVMQVYPFVALSYLTMSPFNMHTALVSVFDKNHKLILYHGLHVAVFFAATYLFVGRFGIVGYGFGELCTIPIYLVISHILWRLIGNVDYRMSLLWWSSFALALFWRELGIWTLVIAIGLFCQPVSIRRLRKLVEPLWDGIPRVRSWMPTKAARP